MFPREFPAFWLWRSSPWRAGRPVPASALRPFPPSDAPGNRWLRAGCSRPFRGPPGHRRRRSFRKRWGRRRRTCLPRLPDRILHIPRLTRAGKPVRNTGQDFGSLQRRRVPGGVPRRIPEGSVFPARHPPGGESSPGSGVPAAPTFPARGRPVSGWAPARPTKRTSFFLRAGS